MTVLVGGFAHVCVEAVITDAHREVASAGLPFLNLLDAAALVSLPHGERPATRCAKAVLFDLATGSMAISRSEVKMEIEPKPLAVSLSALVKLMQPEG